MTSEADIRDTALELRRRLSDSLDDLDRDGVVRLGLDAVRTGRIGIADLYTLALGPTLAEMGTAWQHGSERVWQEHFASHAVRTLVESLQPEVAREAADVPPLGKTALLACPPREAHELGLRMLADRFELAGWRTVFLGADTPLDQIAEAARATRADLVALSVSTVYERLELRSAVDCLRELLPETRIVLGGPAFVHDRDAWSPEDLVDPTSLGLPGLSPAV